MQQIPSAVFGAILALEKSSQATSLKPTHRNLLKLRASQINGCSYCIDLHVTEAIAAGETHRRIHGLTAWRESPFFTPEEKVLLALTEEVTLITGRVSDQVWKDALGLWGEAYLAEVLLALLTINTWNRFAISLEMAPAS